VGAGGAGAAAARLREALAATGAAAVGATDGGSKLLQHQSMRVCPYPLLLIHANRLRAPPMMVPHRTSSTLRNASRGFGGHRRPVRFRQGQETDAPRRDAASVAAILVRTRTGRTNETLFLLARAE
jgi:hypothetical protein